MPSDDQPERSRESNAVVRAMARIVAEAIDRENQLVDWALENDVELVVSCGCRYRPADAWCVCNVELGVGRRWMRAVAKQSKAGESRDPLPSLTCRLCRHGEHDLEATRPIRIAGPDGTVLGTSHNAVRARGSPKDDLDRATRAGGIRPGMQDEQWRLAGLK